MIAAGCRAPSVSLSVDVWSFAAGSGRPGSAPAALAMLLPQRFDPACFPTAAVQAAAGRRC